MAACCLPFASPARGLGDAKLSIRQSQVGYAEWTNFQANGVASSEISRLLLNVEALQIDVQFI